METRWLIVPLKPFFTWISLNDMYETYYVVVFLICVPFCTQHSRVPTLHVELIACCIWLCDALVAVIVVETND